MLSFVGTVFGDPGWPLAVDALLDDGLIPTRDFGYFYGLLALPIDRAWFAIVGRTPMAVVLLTLIGTAYLTLGVIRFGQIMVQSFWPRVLLVAAVPVAVMPLQYPTPLHAIEAGLLMNALAYQARNRYALALALVTIAVFIKPGLAYFHGLMLVVLILSGHGPNTWRERLRSFIPATILLVVIAFALAVQFGLGPLIETQFPFRALHTYQDDNYGFFRGVGSEFWKPIGNPITRYILFPAGFWLVASAWLIVGGLNRIRGIRNPRTATTVTCAALHVIFVVVLFGNEWSWLYYSAILVCGCCAVIGDPMIPDPRHWLAAVLLSLLALSGQYLQTRYAIQIPREQWERSPALGGLYAEPEDATAWNNIRDLARKPGQQVMVFGHSSGAFVVYPEIDSPRVWFLLRSTMTPVEVDRVNAQLRAANWLVVSKAKQYSYPEHWPEFHDEVRKFQIYGEAPSFTLLRRMQP